MAAQIRANSGLIGAACRKYRALIAASHLDLEDVEAELQVTLWTALRTYDSAEGGAFGQYAMMLMFRKIQKMSDHEKTTLEGMNAPVSLADQELSLHGSIVDTVAVVKGSRTDERQPIDEAQDIDSKILIESALAVVSPIIKARLVKRSEGYSDREIATIEGRDHRVVSRSIKRGLKKIRKEMGIGEGK